MNNMFENATSYNQPIDNLFRFNDMCVSDITMMFKGAILFNQPLDNIANVLGLGKVQSLYEFLTNTESFNQSLVAWSTNIIYVTCFDKMLYRARSFDQEQTIKSWIQYGGLDNTDILDIFGMRQLDLSYGKYDLYHKNIIM
jgi:hypothetical protein